MTRIACFDEGNNSSVSLAVTVLTVQSTFSHFIDKLLRSSNDLCYLNYVNIILFRIDQRAVFPFLFVCWGEYLQIILNMRKFSVIKSN